MRSDALAESEPDMFVDLGTPVGEDNLIPWVDLSRSPSRVGRSVDPSSTPQCHQLLATSPDEPDLFLPGTFDDIDNLMPGVIGDSVDMAALMKHDAPDEPNSPLRCQEKCSRSATPPVSNPVASPTRSVEQEVEDLRQRLHKIVQRDTPPKPAAQQRAAELTEIGQPVVPLAETQHPNAIAAPAPVKPAPAPKRGTHPLTPPVVTPVEHGPPSEVPAPPPTAPAAAPVLPESPSLRKRRSESQQQPVQEQSPQESTGSGGDMKSFGLGVACTLVVVAVGALIATTLSRADLS
eukprot:TRINITY_DN46321_c0_g1_i1.p1 TRINITY_DN46321_c0_g1~~TRINITY_DN46321_c0_g1_i1.p1  ORF type:complete len:292 (-),score=71.98 TRINITY_DN46321_c0_g1_i1:205-1080(-)